MGMGRLSHESSRSSIDTTSNGEGLPLYSDVTVTSPGELSAPSEKATPDEVREFLVRLLIKNRGLHPDHARRVASKWTLGTGRELISYPPLLYAEIFGLEDAWMVYKEAKLFIRTEKKKTKRHVGCCWNLWLDIWRCGADVFLDGPQSSNCPKGHFSLCELDLRDPVWLYFTHRHLRQTD